MLGRMAVALAVTIAVMLAVGGCSTTGLVDGDGSGGFESVCPEPVPPRYANTIGVLASNAQRLSGAGSTFVAPIMSAWTKQYATQRGVRVAYQPIGSGGGVAQMTARTVHFGASDTPMTALEIERAGAAPVLHIPVTLGAVVPAYHVSGLGSGLRFDAEILGGIYAGRITRWDDPALRRLNPDRRLPARSIVVVHRADASGTTAVWTEYLTKQSPTWVSALGSGQSSGKQVLWPVGLAGKGNEGVAGMLMQVDGAIGYLELAYVMAQRLPFGQVRNAVGAFVPACPANITAAAEGRDYPADLRTSFTDSRQPTAYPVVGTTYLLVYAEQRDRATAAALVNFVAWVLTTGQDQSAALGYAPLSKQLQQLAFAFLQVVTVDGGPVVNRP